MNTNRFEDFRIWLSGKGYQVKPLVGTDTSFNIYTDGKLPVEIEEICLLFCKQNDSELIKDMETGDSFYHRISKKATLTTEQMLGSDGVAMLYGIEK